MSDKNGTFTPSKTLRDPMDAPASRSEVARTQLKEIVPSPTQEISGATSRTPRLNTPELDTIKRPCPAKIQEV